MSRIVSFIVLICVIAVIGFQFYRVISGFLLPLFLATLLVVMFQPWHRWFVKKCRGRPRLAAALTTASAVAVVVGPLALIMTLSIWELTGVDTRPAAIADSAVVDTRAAPSGFVPSDMVAKTLAAIRRTLESASNQRLVLDARYAREMHFIDASLTSLRSNAAAGATYQGNPDSFKKIADALADLRTRVEYDAERREDNAVREHDKIVLEHVQTLHDALATAGRDPQAAPGTLRHQLQLEQAQSLFRDLQLALHGNSLSIWMSNLLNPTPDQLHEFTNQMSAFAPGVLRSVGGKTGAIVGDVLLTFAITIIAMYFFLVDGPKMIRTLMRLSPLADAHEEKLVLEFDQISRAVVLATLLSAVAQGLLAGVAFWIIGLYVEEFRFVFSLTLLTAVTALVPFVGAAAVWGPVAIWLFFNVPEGGEPHRLAAILLVIYGTGVVSMADNVIKPWVLHGQSNLHPLLALLSVLGGVQALGPIGILVGPMVVVFLQTLLNILAVELMGLEAQWESVPPRAALPFIFSLRQRRLRLHYPPRERIRRIS